jgi:hypothetical protein
VRLREYQIVRRRSVTRVRAQRKGGEGANEGRRGVLRNVEKYYYLEACSIGRMKESGRRHAGRWRGVDAREVQKQVGKAQGLQWIKEKLYSFGSLAWRIVNWLREFQKASLIEHGPCLFRGKLSDEPSRVGLAASNGALVWENPYYEWFGGSVNALREITVISHPPLYGFRYLPHY